MRKIKTGEATLRIDDLANGVYYIRVRSLDVVGASSPSNEVLVEVVRPDTQDEASTVNLVGISDNPEAARELTSLGTIARTRHKLLAIYQLPRAAAAWQQNAELGTRVALRWT